MPQSSEVNRLITIKKMVFLKLLNCPAAYNESCPNLAFPPEPTMTRKGTWIRAACFYTTNLASIKDIVNSFNPEDARNIKEAQQLLKKDSLVADLSYIASNLGFLVGVIMQLEEAGLPHVLQPSLTMPRKGWLICLGPRARF